jgi:hypothetical protein
MVAEGGAIAKGLATTIVIVAVFVAPVASEVVRVTVPGHALAAIVTVMVDVFHVPLPEVPLNALNGSEEDVKYGAVPPEIVKVTVWAAALTTGLEGGIITKGLGVAVGAVTGTLTNPDLPPTEAVILAVMSAAPAASVGAVNDAVAVPPVVCANGGIPPPITLGLVVNAKFTVVPSGTGVPAVVVTLAVTVVFPAEGIAVGFAETATLPTVIGPRNSVITLNAPVDNEVAEIFRGTVKFLSSVGTTLRRVNAWPSGFVVFTSPSGKVASVLSAAKVTVSPTTRVPGLLATVALIIASSVPPEV